MHINPILDEINKARYLGSSNQCYDILYAITRAFQVKTVLEIGTHRGASAIAICQAILDNKFTPIIYTIDNWSQQETKEIAMENFRKAGFDQYIYIITGDSTLMLKELLTFEAAIFQIKNVKEFDMCFIDGSHKIENIKRDCENCKDHCKIMVFHDTGIGDFIYLTQLEKEGWRVINFPTCYVEGDSHLVGIALAVKRDV